MLIMDSCPTYDLQNLLCTYVAYVAITSQTRIKDTYMVITIRM